jgi:hypothetical protein
MIVVRGGVEHSIAAATAAGVARGRRTRHDGETCYRKGTATQCRRRVGRRSMVR